MKPKLYQYAACPFCNKVRATLGYKGVDFETIEVHPTKKTEIAFSSEYKKVPIYIDSKGQQVNDSTAIMRWIDKEFPSPQIFSEDAAESGRDDEWLNWSDKLAKGLPTVIYDTFGNSLKSFNYITKVGKFSWFEKFTIKYSGALIMSLVAKKIKKREQIDDPYQFLRDMTKQWVDGLKGQNFMGGEKPSASDLAVFGISRSVIDLPAGEFLKENQGFKTWMERTQKCVDSSTSPITAASA